MKRNTVTINSVQYDRTTGMPLGMNTADLTAPRRAKHPAKDIHKKLEKSKLLNRKYVTHPQNNTASYIQNKKSSVKKQPIAPTTPATPSKAPRHSTVSTAKNIPNTVAKKSPQVTKFYNHKSVDGFSQSTHKKAATTPQQKASIKSVQSVQLTSTQQPKSVAKQSAKQKKPTTHTPSHILLQQETAKAIREATSHKATRHREKRKSKKHIRLTAALSMASVLVLFGGYFTYLNLPSISVRVAAAQAGIDASYPSYQPNGYSLNGPIAYQDGSVRMAFQLNGTNRGFNITQTRSTWDSLAVLDNIVTPVSGAEYTTIENGGMTIYQYEDNAAWVNRGILYKITSETTLSDDQIKRIAASM